MEATTVKSIFITEILGKYCQSTEGRRLHCHWRRLYNYDD